MNAEQQKARERQNDTLNMFRITASNRLVEEFGSDNKEKIDTILKSEFNRYRVVTF